MSPTWQSETTPVFEKISAMGWVRVLRRGLPMALVTFGCLAILLVARLVERPVFGKNRPITPYITQFVCKTAFLCMGMRHQVQGRPMTHSGAIVSNHASWLDIFAINALDRIYFVAKSEVAGWPGIGWLARATGTVFIRRNARDAKAQKDVFRDRLSNGHKLVFFPEGTSTDGKRVLVFKSTLFASFFDDDMPKGLWIQPATVIYTAPDGADPRFYGWWDAMEFGEHFLQVLAVRDPGSVKVIFHEPRAVADFPDRKSLALALENDVRAGMVAD